MNNLKYINVPIAFISLCDGNAYDAILLAAIYKTRLKALADETIPSIEIDGDLFLLKTQIEWADEVRFNSSKTIRNCFARLKAKGFISTKVKKSIFHDMQPKLATKIELENIVSTISK